MRKIIYTLPEGSHFTGVLSGIYYVEGCQVTAEQFRQEIIMQGVKKVMEMRAMDIVKRAYLATKERNEGSSSVRAFHEAVELEIKRLIRVRAYSGRDWPRELGPMPNELRSKRR